MPPRPDVSEERRDQILDAAAAVFARNGVRDSRMDDIVAEADLSKGALYWYFKSKDELVTAFIERLFARGLERFAEFLKTDQPFKLRMLAISRYVAADIRCVSETRNIALEYYALAARDAKIRSRVREYIETYVELYTAMIQHAIERGECRAIDARKTAVMIEAMYEGTALLSLVGTKAVDIEGMLEHATRLILDSLTATRPEKIEKVTSRASSNR
jgi:AcrR family transcriptional regulator